MKLINKIFFAKVVLGKNFKTFVIHIAALETPVMTIQPLQIAQLINDNLVQITAL